MWYIAIQPVDYDDYPVGSSEKIGLFDSKEDVEAFMSEHPKTFRKHPSFTNYWTVSRYHRRARVSIKRLTDIYMTPPDQFKG